MNEHSPPINAEDDPGRSLCGSKQGGRAVAGGDGVVRITSGKLLGGRRELEIIHGGSVYRLRITSTGKLILTK